MSDFVLEISGDGEAIMLEPVGTIDLTGARTMLEVLETLRRDRRAALLEIRLDRVEGMTADAQDALAGCGLPMGAMVGPRA
jgi:hypothetical protein